MRKTISEAAFLRACRSQRKRFSAFRVEKDGRATVEAALPRSWRCVWFESNEVHEESGQYFVDQDSYTVYMFVDAVLSVVFYVENGSVQSACFSTQLTTGQLTQSVSAMRDAGLGRFIKPAAEQALRVAPGAARKLLGPSLRRLLRETKRLKGRRPKE